MFSCQYSSSARTGNRVTTVVIIKHRTLSADSVYIRCWSDLPYRVPIDTYCLPGMVITHNENYVRSTVLFAVGSLHVVK